MVTDSIEVLITLFVACFNEESKIYQTLETINIEYNKIDCKFEEKIFDN